MLIFRTPASSSLLVSVVRVKLASRVAGADNLAIKGASKVAAAGRMRRNAISLNGDSSGRSLPVGTRAIELWREFVKKRYNPEARFLNLEVRLGFIATVSLKAE